MELRQTGARGQVVDHATLGIGAARLAGVDDWLWFLSFCELKGFLLKFISFEFELITSWRVCLTSWFASNEGIADHRFGTTAYGIVIDNGANGLQATGGWTWVLTFLVVANLVQGAIGANCTLWATAGWCSSVTSQARANCLSLVGSALTERATWTWVAGVALWWSLNNFFLNKLIFENFFR